MVFHGNASGADGILRNMAPIIAKGYGIVSAEWRGYSANAGKADNKDINGIFIDGGRHNFDPAQLLMILEKISITPNSLKYENSQNLILKSRLSLWLH